MGEERQRRSMERELLLLLPPRLGRASSPWRALLLLLLLLLRPRRRLEPRSSKRDGAKREPLRSKSRELRRWKMKETSWTSSLFRRRLSFRTLKPSLFYSASSRRPLNPSATSIPLSSPTLVGNGLFTGCPLLLAAAESAFFGPYLR